MTREEEIDLAWAQHLARSVRSERLSIILRDRLAEQQNWRCCYCGVRMVGSNRVTGRSDPDAPTFEHILPRCRGGTDEIDNLAIACWQCNADRGDREDV